MAEKKGILVVFSVRSNKFKSNYERTIFFKKLYGWKQVVPNEMTEKKYEYERPGILDEMPHEKVGQSSFIIPEDNFDDIMGFFEEWSNKIILRTFKVLLDRDTEKEFDEWEEEDNEEDE